MGPHVIASIHLNKETDPIEVLLVDYSQNTPIRICIESQLSVFMSVSQAKDLFKSLGSVISEVELTKGEE